MKRPACQLLLGLLCPLVLGLSGCATGPKSAKSAGPTSMVLLLPEAGRPSGEVTVVTQQGTQVLNQSWQSVQIAGREAPPGKPVTLDEAAVEKKFGVVLSAMPVPPVHYLLYFKLDSAELLQESRVLLPEIARVLKERQPAQLSVVGHTDTTGSIQHNYRLGRQRAAAVAEALGTLGAKPTGAETSSRGKADPLVRTPDQTPEPRNRRVEVTIR